ncbi:MAG TPA: hypothetical protein VNO18_25665 [Xanthobacteraceae bacterium]|jgi:hypothetical protein|nr:hypothetical protein [Xanthobacteraceae bacterium]
MKIQINFDDAAIVRPDGHGGVAVVGKILSREWSSLGGVARRRWLSLPIVTLDLAGPTVRR